MTEIDSDGLQSLDDVPGSLVGRILMPLKVAAPPPPLLLSDSRRGLDLTIDDPNSLSVRPASCRFLSAYTSFLYYQRLPGGLIYCQKSTSSTRCTLMWLVAMR